MSFNPFIGGSGGSGAPVNAFTKEEIIDLLKLELDVKDYEADKIIFKQQIDKDVKQEIKDTMATQEDNDALMEELFP